MKGGGIVAQPSSIVCVFRILRGCWSGTDGLFDAFSVETKLMLITITSFQLSCRVIACRRELSGRLIGVSAMRGC